MFDNLPIFYAFSVGMVATINPCGFAMLPAYIAYHLGLGDESRSVLARSTYGTGMGLVATLGFVTLFGGVGLIISVGGNFVRELFPFWSLGVGIALVLLGLFLLISRKHIGILAASRFQGPRGNQGRAGILSIRHWLRLGLSQLLATSIYSGGGQRAQPRGNNTRCDPVRQLWTGHGSSTYRSRLECYILQDRSGQRTASPDALTSKP